MEREQQELEKTRAEVEALKSQISEKQEKLTS